MGPILAFDIETIPDIHGLRKLYDLGPEVTSAQVADIAFQRRRQLTGQDFLPLHAHQIIAISCALREGNSFRVWSLGAGADDEAGLVQRFFDGLEKYSPQLISWNGSGFDLPVLNYRALIHGVQAPRFWDLGEEDRDFKWNNYISRYHMRHLDLMDTLALYQNRACAPLDEITKLCGLPGKLGVGGARVWEAYQKGELDAVRRYCECDVLNTYLLFLKFQLFRGQLNRSSYRQECALVRSVLTQSSEPHCQEFVACWPETENGN